MKNWATPSERMHSLVNPLPVTSRTKGTEERTWVLTAKLIFGTPVPVLMLLYCLSLMVSMSAMEILGWTSAALILIYILFDLFSLNREFRFFSIGVDLSLFAFLIIVACGLKINAPEADFWKFFGQLRWVLLLYLFTYGFALFPGLNKFMTTIIVAGSIIGAYAVFQHFSGIDLRYEWGLRAESAVTPAPISAPDVFQSVGLMSHHLTYGYLFSMVICFPLAALMLSNQKNILFRLFLGVSVLAIGASLLWTYGRGVWIACLCAFLFMGTYVSKKLLFSLLIVTGIIFGTLYSSNHGFRQRFDSITDSSYTSNSDRQDLWKANLEMLSDHPWIGIGWSQNEGRVAEYYQKLGIQNTFMGHAHNNYLQILATTGLLGFAAYSFFILGFLFMAHRLWGEIPKSHYWHRVLILGAIGAQISLHAGGLTQWNFGDAEVNHFFIFVLSMVAYMAERYSVGVVPDDHSL